MRAHLVVIDAPGLDDAPCLDERAEHVLVEALVAQLAVEALHEAVLHRLARRDVVPVDPALCRPAQHGVRGQLRAVVGHDHRRLTPDRHQAIEHTHDPLAWQRRVDLYAQAPPRELVLDVEHTKAATALQRVRHEVEHPDRIGASRFLERRSRATRTLQAAAATHFQALLTIEPPDLLQVHDDAAPTRHLTKAAVPEATSLGSELPQNTPLGIVPPTLLLVTHRGSIHRQKPSSPIAGEYTLDDNPSATLSITADKITSKIGPISFSVDYIVKSVEGKNVTIELTTREPKETLQIQVEKDLIKIRSIN